MWFEPPIAQKSWSAAVRHLRTVDPRMKGVIDRVGPCTLAPRKDYFVVLCKSIFSQQISVKVATVLFGRFRDQFPMRRPTPAAVVKAFAERPTEILKLCGLSRQKGAYIKDLAEHFEKGEIPTRRISRMTDEQIIESLVRVKGIGRWTAEMFLIFVLNRPDVLPVDDLGLRDGIREVFGLKERPTARQCVELAEPWRPYRSVATWYLWRRDTEPLKRKAVPGAPTAARSAAGQAPPAGRSRLGRPARAPAKPQANRRP